MPRILCAAFLCFSTCLGAAELTVGVANQHKSALDVSNGRFIGLFADEFQCPLEKAELAFELIVMPHARVLLQLERGEIDIAMPLVRLDRRDQFAAFARPLVRVEFALFSQRPIDPAGDLSNYNFTALRSTASVDLVQQHNGNVTEVSSWPQALELARRGRYDGAVIPLASITNLPAQNFEGLIQTAFGSLPLSFYVSRATYNSDVLLQRLNRAIEACRN